MTTEKLSTFGIHHIAIKTHDCQRLKDFYCTLLNAQPVAEQYDNKGVLNSVWIDCGITVLMIERSLQKQTKKTQTSCFDKDPAGWYLCAFAIKETDRKKWIARLKKTKITICKKTDYSLFFFDPDYNRLALSHFPVRAKA